MKVNHIRIIGDSHPLAYESFLWLMALQLYMKLLALTKMLEYTYLLLDPVSQVDGWIKCQSLQSQIMLVPGLDLKIGVYCQG